MTRTFLLAVILIAGTAGGCARTIVQRPVITLTCPQPPIPKTTPAPKPPAPKEEPVVETSLDLMTQDQVAHHEAAHALVNHLVRPGYPLTRMRVRFIVDTKDASYGTTHTNKVIRLETMKDIFAEAVTTMAGRAAEKLFFGAETDGGGSDLLAANGLFFYACGQSGLCGRLIVEKKLKKEQVSPAVEHLIECYLRAAQKQAEALVRANRQAIEGLARLVMAQPVNKDKEHRLSGEQIRLFLKGQKLKGGRKSLPRLPLSCPK